MKTSIASLRSRPTMVIVLPTLPLAVVRMTHGKPRVG